MLVPRAPIQGGSGVQGYMVYHCEHKFSERASDRAAVLRLRLHIILLTTLKRLRLGGGGVGVSG